MRYNALVMCEACYHRRSRQAVQLNEHILRRNAADREHMHVVDVPCERNFDMDLKSIVILDGQLRTSQNNGTGSFYCIDSKHCEPECWLHTLAVQGWRTRVVTLLSTDQSIYSKGWTSKKLTLSWCTSVMKTLQSSTRISKTRGVFICVRLIFQKNQPSTHYQPIFMFSSATCLE